MRSISRLGYVGLGLLAGAALAGCGAGSASPADAAVDAPDPSADLGAPSDLGLTSDGNPTPPADAGPAGCVPDRAAWDSVMRAHVQRQCGTCHGEEPNYGAPFTLLDVVDRLRALGYPVFETTGDVVDSVPGENLSLTEIDDATATSKSPPTAACTAAR